MVKNGHFLIKNEYQRPRFRGGLFDHKKRVPFIVRDRFSSMEIVSEPATPALKIDWSVEGSYRLRQFNVHTSYHIDHNVMIFIARA